MKKIGFLTLLISVYCFSLFAQPASEIFLLDLSIDKNGVTISNPVNITNHPGYDNQPYFHPDKNILYYASADTSGRTDLYQFDYTKNETLQFTKTPDREYSPTVTPDKKFISCILQRDDGAQDVVKYPITGGAPGVVVNTLKVGYHAWADETNLALFVLGESNTLHWFQVRPPKDIVLVEHIGRSLHRLPGKKSISFVHKLSDEFWNIKIIREEDGKIETITQALPGKEDLAWTPDGKILMSDGDSLFFFDTSSGKTWQAVKSAVPLPFKGISRIAVNSKGDKLALVVAE